MADTGTIDDHIKQREIGILMYIGNNTTQKLSYNDGITRTAVMQLEQKELIAFSHTMGLGGIPEYSLTDKGKEIYDTLAIQVTGIYKGIPELNRYLISLQNTYKKH